MFFNFINAKKCTTYTGCFLLMFFFHFITFPLVVVSFAVKRLLSVFYCVFFLVVKFLLAIVLVMFFLLCQYFFFVVQISLLAIFL